MEFRKKIESLIKLSKNYPCFKFLGHMEKPRTSKFKSCNSQKKVNSRLKKQRKLKFGT